MKSWTLAKRNFLIEGTSCHCSSRPA